MTKTPGDPERAAAGGRFEFVEPVTGRAHDTVTTILPFPPAAVVVQRQRDALLRAVALEAGVRTRGRSHSTAGRRRSLPRSRCRWATKAFIVPPMWRSARREYRGRPRDIVARGVKMRPNYPDAQRGPHQATKAVFHRKKHSALPTAAPGRRADGDFDRLAMGPPPPLAVSPDKRSSPGRWSGVGRSGSRQRSVITSHDQAAQSGCWRSWSTIAGCPAQVDLDNRRRTASLQQQRLAVARAPPVAVVRRRAATEARPPAQLVTP